MVRSPVDRPKPSMATWTGAGLRANTSSRLPSLGPARSTRMSTLCLAMVAAMACAVWPAVENQPSAWDRQRRVHSSSSVFSAKPMAAKRSRSRASSSGGSQCIMAWPWKWGDT